PRERHRPGATHPPVRGLEAHDAAAGGREPDRAARVAPEGAYDEARRDRRRGAARGAAGRVAALPRVLDVAVVGIVTEGAERQLGHVELAERDGAGVPEAAHRTALAIHREVVARLRPARG